ncbi:MAG TPA: acyltransferase [Baekduia sp.]|jgi:peptidoglycan/LPS O-acetylase OafA/YrhL
MDVVADRRAVAARPGDSVSPAVAPPPGQPRFPGLDALRGFAIAAVVFCHAIGSTGAWEETSWGWISYYAQAGVTVFLVLSGFLLYRPFAAAHADRGHGPTAARFARRRALRILPAYWVALTVLSVWPGTHGTFSGDWYRYYTFTQGYWRASTAGGLGGVAWSLVAEVAFYALLPLLAWGAARLARGRAAERWWRGELVVIVAFGLVSPLVYIVLPLSQALGHTLFPGFLVGTLIGVTDWFAAGMLLAVVSVAAARGDGRARRVAEWIRGHGVALWAGALVMWLLFARLPWLAGDGLAVLFPWHLCETLAGVLLVAPVVFVAPGSAIDRITLWRPLALLGLISYGVYLWHYVLLSWLAGTDPALARGPGLASHRDPDVTLLVGTFVLSVAVATVSYRFLELPFLRRKDAGPRRSPRRGWPG